MKRTFIILIFLLWSVAAFGATYNIGPGETYVTFSDLVAAENLAAGDIVDGGGNTFLETWTVDGDGSSGNPIILRNAIIDGESTRARCIDINEHDYITLNNLTLKDATTYIVDGTGNCTGLVVTGCTISGTGVQIIVQQGSEVQITSNSFTQGNNRCIWLDDIAGAGVTGAIVSGNTVTGGASSTLPAFRFDFSDGLTLSNNSISGWKMDTSATYTIDINNTDVVLGSGNNLTNCDGQGFVFVTCTGLNIASWSVTGQESIGFHFFNTTGTAAACSSAGCGSHGMQLNQAGTNMVLAGGSSSNNVGGQYCGVVSINGATSIIGNHFSADGNGEDGFNIQNSGSMTLINCTADGNGVQAAASSGDGATAHDATTMNVIYCTFVGNYKSGIAMTGASTGAIYNNTCYNNYSALVAGNYGIWINSTGNWDIRNNITIGHEQELEITATSIIGAPTLIIDNNRHYNSRGGNAYHWNGTDYAILSAFISAASGDGYILYSSFNTEGDPKLINLAGNNFRLRGDSPCINTGSNTPHIGAVSRTDLAGRSITNSDGAIIAPGGTVDIGAYEYASTGDDLFLIKMLRKRRR